MRRSINVILCGTAQKNKVSHRVAIGGTDQKGNTLLKKAGLNTRDNGKNNGNWRFETSSSDFMKIYNYADLASKELKGEIFFKAKLAPMAKNDNIEQTLQDAGYSNPETLALEAYNNPSKINAVVKKVIKALTQKEEPEPNKPVERHNNQDLRLKTDTDKGIIVGGAEGVMVRFAQCCNPEPGDEIIGYVSLSRGVSIHRMDCKNIHNYKQNQSPRLIEANWRDQALENFRTELQIVFIDTPGLLRQLGDSVAAQGAELMEVHLKGDGKIARGSISCMVSSKKHSEDLKQALQSIGGSLKVQRKTQ